MAGPLTRPLTVGRKPRRMGRATRRGAAIQSAEAAFASFGAPEGFRTCTSQNAAAT